MERLKLSAGDAPPPPQQYLGTWNLGIWYIEMIEER